MQLLEQRINEFIRTGETLLEDQHVHSPHIEHQIKQLKDRWNHFKQQVRDTRRLIDLSIQYFQLVDEVNLLCFPEIIIIFYVTFFYRLRNGSEKVVNYSYQ